MSASYIPGGLQPPTPAPKSLSASLGKQRSKIKGFKFTADKYKKPRIWKPVLEDITLSLCSGPNDQSVIAVCWQDWGLLSATTHLTSRVFMARGRNWRP